MLALRGRHLLCCPRRHGHRNMHRMQARHVLLPGPGFVYDMSRRNVHGKHGQHQRCRLPWVSRWNLRSRVASRRFRRLLALSLGHVLHCRRGDRVDHVRALRRGHVLHRRRSHLLGHVHSLCYRSHCSNGRNDRMFSLPPLNNFQCNRRISLHFLSSRLIRLWPRNAKLQSVSSGYIFIFRVCGMNHLFSDCKSSFQEPFPIIPAWSRSDARRVPLALVPLQLAQPQ